jgi:NET1-associated nuclear protein 1 (U3 small nucleolar RNA-associated protein 17)
MELTCLALHPNEDCIATGAINGKIILWYNYLACLKDKNKLEETQSYGDKNQKKAPFTKHTMSILHWHSLPVITLRFTPEGSFLLSGGHECVLVKWFYKSGQKDFRARLGSPIGSLHSSNDNTLYVTKHLDNCLDFYF